MSVVAGGGAGVDQDDPQVGRLPLQRVPEAEQYAPEEAVREAAAQDAAAQDAVAEAGIHDANGSGTAAGDEESEFRTFESALEAQEARPAPGPSGADA